MRRTELRKMVPLADTTIYKWNVAANFLAVYLTSRRVAWDLGKVEVWMRERRLASRDGLLRLAAMPDVRQRKVHWPYYTLKFSMPASIMPFREWQDFQYSIVYARKI